MNIRIFQSVRWLPIAVLMFAGSACNLAIGTQSAANPQFIVVTATGTTGQSVPLLPSSTLKLTIPSTATMAFTPTLTATSTKPPVTMTAGQDLSCVKGPQWILYEWVARIVTGETVTLLARSSSDWPDYFYVRKPDGTECWAFGGSSTKSGDPSTLPVMEAPPLPTVAYTIENQTHLPVCSIYIRHKGESDWGANRLGAGTINPGTIFELNITAGFYDVQMRDCFGGILYGKSNTPIGSEASSHYALVNMQIHFSITNNSSTRYCVIRAKPTDGGAASDFLTHSDPSFDPGATLSVSLLAGIYDITFYPCDAVPPPHTTPSVYIGGLTTNFPSG
jgi:hypothetical protein